MIYSAFFIALGFIFPVVFHMVGMGKIFLPMFWPMAACGFFLTWPYAVSVGLLTPLISMLLTGMPPVPILQLMMAEFVVLILTIRYFRQKTSLGVFWIVLTGMLASRVITWIIAGWIAPLFGLPPDLYALTRMVQGIPGFACILFVVPLLIHRIQHLPVFRMRKSHVPSPS